MSPPNSAPVRSLHASPGSSGGVGVIAALLLTTFFWGSSFAVVKVALLQLQPLAIASLRFGIAAAVFAVLLAARRGRYPKVPPRDFAIFFGLSLFGVTTYFWVQYTALTLTTAMNASLIIATSPLVVLLLSARKEPLGLRRFLGAGLCYGGVLLVVLSGARGQALSPHLLRGNLLMLFNACCWALFTLMGRRTLQRYPAFLVTAWLCIFGGLGLLPLGLSAGLWEALPRLTWQTSLAMLYLAVPCTVLAYLLWYHALERVPASRVAPFQYLQPLYTALLGALLLGEVPGWKALLGGCLIITGLLAAHPPRR